MNERAWYRAESLHGTAHSPSLAALARWARRYRCYVAATLLEATRDGHIYNSLVLAAPDGSFVTHPAGGGGSSSDSSSSSTPGASQSGSLCLVRKHRASSLEGFVFRSAGAAGRGGEPWAHVLEVDAAPLLQKRGGAAHGVSCGEGSTAAGSGSGGAVGSWPEQAKQAKLRLAFSICYENYCAPPMEAIRVRG